MEMKKVHEEQKFVEIIISTLFHSRLQKIIIITPNDPEDKHAVKMMITIA